VSPLPLWSTGFTHRDSYSFLLRAKRGGGGPRSGGGGGSLRDANKHTLDRFVVQNFTRRRSQYPNAVLPKPTISALVLSSPRFKVVSGTINLDDQARRCGVVISHKSKPVVGSCPLHRFAVPLPRASREGGTCGETVEKCECRSLVGEGRKYVQ